MSGVFVNYRRSESREAAIRIADGLARELGEDQVFLDTEDIEYGRTFPQVIERTLNTVDSMVVVIGPTWTDITDSQGRRRLDNPEDFVRREIAHALKRDIRVVPVLIKGARIPGAEQLPEDIASLASRQAIELDDRTFIADLDRLAKALRGSGTPMLGLFVFLAAAIGMSLSFLIRGNDLASDALVTRGLANAVQFGLLSLGVLWGLRRTWGLKDEYIIRAVLFVGIGEGLLGRSFEDLHWGLISLGVLYGVMPVSGMNHRKIIYLVTLTFVGASLGALGGELVKRFADFLIFSALRRSVQLTVFWVVFAAVLLIGSRRVAQLSWRQLFTILVFVALGSLGGALLGDFVKDFVGDRNLRAGLRSGILYGVLAIAVSYSWKLASPKVASKTRRLRMAK